MSLSPSSSILQSRLNAVFAGGQVDSYQGEPSTYAELWEPPTAASEAASRLPWRQEPGSSVPVGATQPGQAPHGAHQASQMSNHWQIAAGRQSMQEPQYGDAAITDGQPLPMMGDKSEKLGLDSSKLEAAPYNVHLVQGQYRVGSNTGPLLQPTGHGILDHELSDVLEQQSARPLQRRRQAESFWLGAQTISFVDFVPSQPEDTLDDCLELMNDWMVRQELGREAVVNIETLETEWPEPSVFTRTSGGLVSRASYWVRFLRVYYRSEGQPRSDRVYAQGDKATPQNFAVLNAPKVAQKTASGLTLAAQAAPAPFGVKFDRAVVVLMISLIVANSYLLFTMAVM